MNISRNSSRIHSGFLQRGHARICLGIPRAFLQYFLQELRNDFPKEHFQKFLQEFPQELFQEFIQEFLQEYPEEFLHKFHHISYQVFPEEFARNSFRNFLKKSLRNFPGNSRVSVGIPSRFFSLDEATQKCSSYFHENLLEFLGSL